MKRYLTIFSVIIILSLAGAALYFYTQKKGPVNSINQSPQQTNQTNQQTPAQEKAIHEPIENAKAHITKKPFGIYITPQNSPVQPERFSGYHTGTDFEVTSDELNKEVPVFAISDGVILEIRKVSGYGGVIIQSAKINGENTTVLYGHILINESFTPTKGDNISKDTKIATVAPNKSEYSDGERKHLHAGIHKGTDISYAGYVNTKTELSAWLNIENFL